MIPYPAGAMCVMSGGGGGIIGGVSGRARSSVSPCANWHFLPYGQRPAVPKFWQIDVL